MFQLAKKLFFLDSSKNFHKFYLLRNLKPHIYGEIFMKTNLVWEVFAIFVTQMRRLGVALDALIVQRIE